MNGQDLQQAKEGAWKLRYKTKRSMKWQPGINWVTKPTRSSVICKRTSRTYSKTTTTASLLIPELTLWTKTYISRPGRMLLFPMDDDGMLMVTRTSPLFSYIIVSWSPTISVYRKRNIPQNLSIWTVHIMT
jgi:hypothetical protein